MTVTDIRNEWCKLKGYNYIDFATLTEAEEYIIFLEYRLILERIESSELISEVHSNLESIKDIAFGDGSAQERMGYIKELLASELTHEGNI